MPLPPRPKALQHFRTSDLRGVVQLATQATRGVARMAEGVHQSVWGSMGVPGGKTAGTTRGLTGLIYQTVQGVTQLVGSGAEAILGKLQPLLDAADTALPDTPQREAVLAALNGVLGDRLAASGNPLATHLQLRHAGHRLDWARPDTLPAAATVGGKLLITIHGLCMNDLQWTHTTATGEVRSHAHALAAVGYTPVYVRYNTGLHTSDNGAALAAELEQLVAHWPVPVTDITVLAHSMGGLVTRSAVQQARAANPAWLQVLKNIVFLGTPHHGAPLERAGNWVDVILGATPYSRPFAKLGQLRSAGITDLRYGCVSPEDWQGRNRFHKGPDRRLPVPLPEGVACYTVAATTASQRGALADRLLGDGLVPLRSALGLHDEAKRTLVFAKPSQCIAYKMNHMELLHRPEVTAQLLAWLAPGEVAG
ncbi:MAG: permease [Curvibacter sp. RIFCSPHIGHO2_12_FULL_63_18]|uniref:esterase/lipase family protein n=1 Tax=Rhodoferax sp. TaxID=50421 RepID=UPI0008BE3798|nr:alpha/beta hydrolase [Rhodoferax sp.]OGO95290.1 MAG: permease [Curvibacter sp. GWA2_63_95]OGO99243.1 MAG: permease [Curvibacter sp. RIFCSPHIGHO2_12_FULL_63_18]HCX81205.1 permease [Rhodoferax sp.]